ncbi:MAG: hypothetical protein ACTSUE_26415 [Promethearchaeota archaeon]
MISTSFGILYMVLKAWQNKKQTLKARVVEKQIRTMARYKDYAEDPDDVGKLSFGNGALHEYKLWMEIEDKKAAREFGINTVCEMDGFEYRKEWDKIPKEAQATLCLKRMFTQHENEQNKETSWDLAWMELDRNSDTGDFIVLNDE